MTDIKSLSFDELSTALSAFGLPGFRSKQVWQWLQQKGVMSFDEMTNLSKDLREKLSAERKTHARAAFSYRKNFRNFWRMLFA